MSQERINRTHEHDSEISEEYSRALGAEAVKQTVDETVLDDTDDILDEIDRVLEDEEFIDNFVQKGGQ